MEFCTEVTQQPLYPSRVSRLGSDHATGLRLLLTLAALVLAACGTGPRPSPAPTVAVTASDLDDFDAGLRHYEAFEYDRAADRFERAAAADPEDAEAELYLLQAQLLAGRREACGFAGARPLPSVEEVRGQLLADGDGFLVLRRDDGTVEQFVVGRRAAANLTRTLEGDALEVRVTPPARTGGPRRLVALRGTPR